MRARATLRFLSGAAAFFCGAAGAWAEAAETVGKTLPAADSASILGPIFRMIGALLLVFALLFLGVWFLKNWPSVLRRGGPAPKLRVMEVKSLGARQALYVVGYERQRFMIASSPAGVKMLTALPDAAELSSEAAPAAPSFSDVLQKVAGKP
jgi:flagellar biogenesis protein FliO